MTLRFYLGTHRPYWLWLDTPPLCVPRQQLEERRLDRLKPAKGRWFLDSGGFSELEKHGRWTVSPERYVDMVREWSARIGGLDWVAPQDWMCEPKMLAITGKTVLEHQELTVENGLLLRQLAPELPWRYAVQGGTVAEYVHCVELYRRAGVDLAAEPLVGVGSVCRRQHTPEIAEIFRVLHDDAGLTMHGFGVKTLGFRLYARYLASADSLAWSRRARWIGEPLPECVGVLNERGQPHKNCANCLVFARKWYAEREAELMELATMERPDEERMAA